MRNLIRSVSVLSLAAATLSAHAALTAYTTSAAFTANVQSGSYLETFTQSAADSGASFTYSGGTPAHSYTATAPGSTSTAGVYRSGTIIGNNRPNEQLAFTPTSGNISAIGGEFFITNLSDTFQAQPVNLTVTDSLGASLNLFYTPTSASVGSFRGFTSTGLITSITLTAPAATFYNNADNVRVGRANPVPEPSACAALGLGAVAMLRRRKRA